jgi:hypothetical protein
MDETGGKKPRRRKVKRFTAERRAAYLEHLRRTGNGTAAAAAIGMHRDCAEKRRKRDAAFALDCMAAEAEAARILAGATDCFDGVADPASQIIRRGPNGRTMIVATRQRKWSKTVETIFLDALRHSGNISAAARAAGVSLTTIYKRRREWPAFAGKLEQALDDAEVAIEFRVACEAGGSEDEVECKQDAAGSETEAEPRPPQKFDPDLAFRFLKWREEKRRGRAPRRGRVPAEPSIEEVRDEVVRRVAAIKRHREQDQLAEGWTRDEEGRMIPPGWVRAAPAEGGEESGSDDAQD